MTLWRHFHIVSFGVLCWRHYVLYCLYILDIIKDWNCIDVFCHLSHLNLCHDQGGMGDDSKHFVDAFNVRLVTESDIWSPEEIEAYTAAILKVDKDFFTVAREVGAVSCS